MMRALRLDRSGASAAEFAMVLPLLLMFLFGIIDGGRYLWEVNKAEKATQMGARFAIVTNPVASGLTTQSYLGVGGLTQGDVIPASALSPVTCTSAGASCSCSGSCPASLTKDSTAFDAIVTTMRRMKPDIASSQVVVSYRGSGLGFAGDPNGMDIAPLVTVELTGAQFHPITLMPFGVTDLPLPTFRTTLTAEDSAGTESN